MPASFFSKHGVPIFHHYCRVKIQHGLGAKENMKEGRRNVRLRISTWSDITIRNCECRNRASKVRMFFSLSSCYILYLASSAGTWEVLQESKKKCPNHTLRSNYQRSTGMAAHSVKITATFFQKMALIYGCHVTTKRQIIFISVLDPLVSAKVSILRLTILKQRKVINYTHCTGKKLA